MTIMTGLQHQRPRRIVWFNLDGTVYQTESVPTDTNPHQYARDAMNTDNRKHDYYVIEG